MKDNAMTSACGESLPLPIVELVLALAPRVNHVGKSTTALLGVLPRRLVPTAFRVLILAANSNSFLYRYFNNDFFGQAVIPLPALALGRLFASLSEQDPLDQWVQLLTTLMPDPEDDSGLCKRIANTLCRGGHFKAVKYLHESVPSASRWIQASAHEALLSRHLPLITWIHEVFGGLQLNPHQPLSYLGYAAEHGDIDLMDWLVENVEWLRSHVHMAQAIMAAIKAGHEDVFDHLCTEDAYEWHTQDIAPYLCMCEVASEHGQIRILQQLTRDWNVIDPIASRKAMDLASANGHVDILEWWVLETQQHIYSIDAMDDASANGHLHVLEWWARSGLEMRFTPAAKTRAIEAGHWDVVKFWNQCGAFKLLAYGPRMTQLLDHVMIPTRDVATLAAFGRLDWLHAVYGPSLARVPREKLDQAFKAAIQFGHVRILETYTAEFSGTELGRDANGTLALAATHGQFDVLQWLLNDSGIVFSFKGNQLHSCLMQSLKHGHLHLVQWLVQHPSVQRHLAEGLADNASIVRHAIQNGDVKLLSFLHALGLVDDHSGYTLLSLAAKYGHVAVFEWWLNASGLDLPPLEHPIVVAMQHSKLEVLDWWLRTPVCHHILNKERMLNELIVEQNYDTLKWFQTNAEKLRGE